MNERKKRILFVDDEINLLQGLRRMLHGMRAEWDMSFVSSAPEALEELARQPYDVLVTDMRMPGMNGAELLEHVREEHPQVARLVLSGHSDREMLMQAAGLAHQFISKPCDTELLKQVIARSHHLREVLRDESLRALFMHVESIPSIPAIYTRLVKEIQGEDASIQRVGQIISEDPGMTAKVLQLVNSAFFGLPRHISNPMQAVNLLGLETIKALALVVHIFTEYGDQLRGEVQVSDIWRHILRVGSCARDLTRVETGSEKQAEESFVAGLLHDVGKLVLAANMPAAYHTMLELCRTEHLSLLDAEMRVFNAHHATAGGFLLGVWGLPDSLIEAIIFHHRPLEAPTQGSTSLKMVHVADVMVELNDQHPELQTEGIAQEQLETMVPVDCLSYLQAIGELGHLEQWWQLCQITLQAEQEREAEDERKNPVRR